MFQLKRTITPNSNTLDKTNSSIDEFIRQSDSSTSCLKRISDLDRFMSAKLAEISNPIIETLLLPFALAFNRFQIIITNTIALLIAYFKFDIILKTYGFAPLSSEAKDLTKFRIAGYFTLYLIMALLFCVICT